MKHWMFLSVFTILATCSKGDSSWTEALTLGPPDNSYDGQTIDIGATEFNKLFRENEYHIIKKECKSCVATHKEFYYRRITDPDAFDAYDYMKFWKQQNNEVSKDFNLYSTLNDALTEQNAWSFCNYNDVPGVGCCRDCGPHGYVACQWTPAIGEGGYNPHCGKAAKYSVYTIDLCNDAETRCNDNNECTTDSCDVSTGDCIHEDKICDDQDDCTTNSCDINSGECKYEEIPCSNNVYCDGEEYCDGGQCMDAVDIDCPDNFVCDEDAKDCMRDCNLFAIDGYLRDCSSEFAGNENDISELQGNGQDLQDQIDGIGESIEGLETGIDALSTALTTVQDQIGESLEENPDTIYNMLASQFEDINNVETALGEAKEKLSDEITDINSGIEGIKSNIISIEEDIESMNTNAQAIGVVVQTLQVTLANLDTLVKAFAPHAEDEKKEENGNGQSGQSVVGVPFISWNDKNILIIGLLIVNMMLLTVLLVYCCMSKRKYTYQPIHYNSETDQEVTPLNK